MKKNIFILLLLPFLLAIFGIVGVSSTISIVDNKIAYISFNYEDYEGFDLAVGEYELEASIKNASRYEIINQSDLVWTVSNVNKEESSHARIVKRNDRYYLKAISKGLIKVTCSNSDRTVSKSFTGVVYYRSAIIVKPLIERSLVSNDPVLYVGKYDLNNGVKEQASYKMRFVSIPSSQELYIKQKTDNIKVDLDNEALEILKEGTASFTLANNSDVEQNFSFEVVDGVNVYSYDDLLNCSNRSETGETIVLQKSFESLTSANESDRNNVESFGNDKNGKFDFSKDIYRFESTYNTEYIDQWNEFAKTKTKYREISKEVKAGLHITKDIYGNGHTINFHNLAYPYRSISSGSGDNEITYPALSKDNLFRGPLPFYTLGDPNNNYIVSMYGQDNIGLYVDGDDISINNLNVSNCDPVGSNTFLKYVGTVLDVNGRNINIVNSTFSNGKNVARTFSSDVNFVNCSFKNAQNFLLYAGSNKYEKIDLYKPYDFKTLEGLTVTQTIADYLAEAGYGDLVFNAFVNNVNSSNLSRIKDAIETFEKCLSDMNPDLLSDGDIFVTDCNFFNSGVSSVGVDTLFNGPFMLTGSSPSYIGYLLDKFGATSEQLSIIPMIPYDIGGIEHPVNINVLGTTSFKDFKEIGTLDISGLLDERVSSTFGSLFGEDGSEKGINSIFPMVNLVKKRAGETGFLTNEEGKDFINIPVAYFGGGINKSKVTIDATKGIYGGENEIDLLEEYLKIDNGYFSKFKKIVATTTGYSPFKFIFAK